MPGMTKSSMAPMTFGLWDTTFELFTCECGQSGGEERKQERRWHTPAVHESDLEMWPGSEQNAEYGAALRCPFWARGQRQDDARSGPSRRAELAASDERHIKAALTNVLDVSDTAAARRVGRAAVTVLLAVASEMRDGAVIESVWRDDEADGLLRLSGRVVEVFCRCDSQVLQTRYAARVRQVGYVSEHSSASHCGARGDHEPSTQKGGQLSKLIQPELWKLPALVLDVKETLSTSR